MKLENCNQLMLWEEKHSSSENPVYQEEAAPESKCITQ